MAQLAFYKGSGTLADKAIRVFTGSRYSHVELVLDGKCYSSSLRDGGVRSKYINLHPDKWDVVGINCREQLAYEWFRTHDGERYDWWGVWRFLLPLLPNKADQWFCSEAVAAALGLSNAEDYTPEDLFQGFR